MGRNYWMVVESQEEFEVTKELGFTLHGVGARYRRRAQRMQPDDRMLFYVTTIRKWTGTATIRSGSFEDHKPIWKPTRRGDTYPYRVKLSPDVVLEEEDYIDALLLAPGLEYIRRWAPEDWPLAFHDKLHLLPQRDFRLIEAEMKRNLRKRRDRARQAKAEKQSNEPVEDAAEAIPEAQGQQEDSAQSL